MTFYSLEATILTGLMRNYRIELMYGPKFYNLTRNLEWDIKNFSNKKYLFLLCNFYVLQLEQEFFYFHIGDISGISYVSD